MHAPHTHRGFRAYLAVKDKMAEYQAYLNDLILTHNLDNNAGEDAIL
jgi:hypothetical protein